MQLGATSVRESATTEAGRTISLDGSPLKLLQVDRSDVRVMSVSSREELSNLISGSSPTKQGGVEEEGANVGF
eukprot:GSA25T00022182001.1